MLQRKARSQLTKRLVPLYAAVFLQGFVLWYATEKLFMTSIGFDAATIGVMVALYSAVILLTETPSGILADRWSRKGVVIVAAISLALSGIIGGLSTNIPIFLVSACFWGLYFSLYSGTYDSILYDTLLEETGKSEGYEKLLGTAHFFDGFALVLGSILGGIVAELIGLRETYFYTAPIALLSIIALLSFKEPKLHKQEVASPILLHIKETLGAVLQKGTLAYIVAVLVLTSLSTFIVLEFSQVWLIALAVPLILYGPINAGILAGYGSAGALGRHLQLQKKSTLFTVLALAIISSIILAASSNIILVVAALIVITITFTLITIAFTKLLHDSLHSKIRAGAASAVSSIGRTLIIPIVLVFGYVSNQSSIFSASWILVGLLGFIGVFAVMSFTKSHR